MTNIPYAFPKPDFFFSVISPSLRHNDKGIRNRPVLQLYSGAYRDLGNLFALINHYR